MRLVLDVNLPPKLAEALRKIGLDAVHWTDVGPTTAPDSEILAWAAANDRAIVTQDLDFPELLALSNARLPSVVLLRNANALGPSLASILKSATEQCRDALNDGAIVVVDARGLRVRTLPIDERDDSV